MPPVVSPPHAQPGRDGTPAQSQAARVVSTACALLAAAIGGLVLVGWFTRVPALLTIFPGTTTPMLANTAVAMMLAGGGLALCVRDRRRIAAACACAAAAIGVASIAEYVWEVDLGIDTLLLDPWTLAGQVIPGRMATYSAGCFVLLGTAILLLSLRTRVTPPVVPAAMVGVVLALTGKSALNYLTQGYLPLSGGVRMAAHTALCFTLLAVGVLIEVHRRHRAGPGPSRSVWEWAGATLAVSTVLGGTLSWAGWLERRDSTPPGSGPLLSFALVLAVVSAIAVHLAVGEHGRRREADALNLRLAAEVAARTAAEAQLQEHRDQLEHIIAERTAALEASHQRLRVSERMASIGTLAAGLGHDMGNLLLPIRVRAELIRSLPVPPEALEHLDVIEQSAKYLRNLSQGLRLLAMDPDDDAASAGATDIAPWWNDNRGLLRGALPVRAEVSARIAPGLPLARVAPHRLTQAILNLFTNSAEATLGRDPATITFWAEPDPGGGVRIGITDNGAGMSLEVRRRALEPFFSTKDRGVSTGLGLSLVHGIARSAGGEVGIDSEPGAGCTVWLRLPAAPSRPAAGTPGCRIAVGVRDPRRRALVVAMARAEGLEVVDTTADVSVWAIDADTVSVAAARDFLAASKDRRVVAIGVEGPEWEALGPSLFVIPPVPVPGRVRQILRAACGLTPSSESPVPASDAQAAGS